MALGAGRKQRLGCVLNKTTAFLLLHPTPGSLGVQLPEAGHGGSQEHLLGGRGPGGLPGGGFSSLDELASLGRSRSQAWLSGISLKQKCLF